MADRRVVVLSYFGADAVDGLLRALDAGILPRGVAVHVGSYGIAPRLARQLAELPDAQYSPMFALTRRTGFWNRRTLSPEEERKLPRSGARWTGPLPPLAALLGLAPATRLAWATELGRRFRDALRTQRRRGLPIPSWQLDEVVSQAAGSRVWRELVRGALDGLALGRNALGDAPEAGVVWMAHRALPLAGRPSDAELERFWRSLDRAARHLVGEEYPAFVGDPRASARVHDAGRRALVRGGAVRRSLAAKYAAGLTPGLHLRPGLGGNVAGRSPAAVRRWRSLYIAERAAEGVHAFAEFDLRGPNATPAVIAEVLREIAHALRRA